MTKEAEAIIKGLNECLKRSELLEHEAIIAALIYIIKRLEDIPNKTHHLTNPEG